MSYQQAHHFSGLRGEDEAATGGAVYRILRNGDEGTPMYRVDVAQMMEMVNGLADRRWATQEDVPQSIALPLGGWGRGQLGWGDRLLGKAAIRRVLDTHAIDWQLIGD